MFWLNMFKVIRIKFEFFSLHTILSGTFLKCATLIYCYLVINRQYLFITKVN